MGRRRPAATATLAASLVPKTFPRAPLSLPVLAVPRTEAGSARARVLRRTSVASTAPNTSPPPELAGAQLAVRSKPTVWIRSRPVRDPSRPISNRRSGLDPDRH
jgi:hypothetical protein